MKKNRYTSERGQAMILFVLGIVGLLGFTALAIDGGMIYAERRRAQNGTDASSLAGGASTAMYLDNNGVNYLNWNCSGNVLPAITAGQAAAISRAAANNYTVDTDLSDNNGVQGTCGAVDNGSWIDKYVDIRALVTADTQTAFVHFVFSGPIRNTVEAITRIRPRTPVAFGNAIVALREDCPNQNTGGVHFDGNSTLSVTGGGIFSNACMKATGSVSANVYGGYNITCTGTNCLTTSGHPTLEAHDGGQVQSGSLHLPPGSYAVPPPDCSSVPDQGSHTGSGTISPGRYSSITVHSSSNTLLLNPGLYCLSGNFDVNGGTLTGNGVTIYITSGNFSVGGNVQVNLTAPPARGCTYCPPPLPGVLVYLAEGNTGEADLMGTADSQYLGLVYVPSGTIEAGGTGSELSTIHAQLVADTVKLHGNTNVVINFDGDDNYQIAPKLELFK